MYFVFKCKNLYGWEMSQKLPVNGFKQNKNESKFNQNQDEYSSEGYIFEVDVKYPKRLQNIHGDLSFLPE